MWVARDAFDALVTGATHSAFRLETREQYNEPGETTPFRRFLASPSMLWPIQLTAP